MKVFETVEKIGGLLYSQREGITGIGPCVICKYCGFDAEEESIMPEDSYCKRYPPAPAVILNKVCYVWPNVEMERDGCGEFKIDEKKLDMVLSEINRTRSKSRAT